MASYLDLVGPPPNVRSERFLSWVEKLIEKRRAEVAFPRTGPTYYISASGNDSNNGTSPATPWLTLSKVQTTLTGLSAGNETAGTTFLFKRGDIWRYSTSTSFSTAINIRKNNVKIGAYGDTFENKPEITYFSLTLAAGATWTDQDSGTPTQNRWSIALSSWTNPGSFTAPGWIREPLDSFNPYMACTSTAEVSTNPRSFFFDTGTSTLHLNPGYTIMGGDVKRDPSDIDFEATGDSTLAYGAWGSANCFVSNDADGGNKIWWDNLLLTGWGCSPYRINSMNTINVGKGLENSYYISDVEAYYGGYHHLGQLTQSGGPSGSTGGRLLMERCAVGLTSDANTNSPGITSYVAFAPSGGNECLHVDCSVDFAVLPDTYTKNGGRRKWLHGEFCPTTPFYAHTSSDSTPLSLMIFKDCQSKDRRLEYPYATATGSIPTVGNSPGADVPENWRTYVIGYKTPLSIINGTGNFSSGGGSNPLGQILGSTREWIINSNIVVSKSWNVGSTDYLGFVLSQGPYSYLLNCTITVLDISTESSVLINNQNTIGRIGFENCLFNIYADGSSYKFAMWPNYSNTTYHPEPFGMKNCVINSFGTKPVFWSGGNFATFEASRAIKIAIYNAQVTGAVTNWVDYSSLGSNLLNLLTSTGSQALPLVKEIGVDNPLARQGFSTGLKYDLNGSLRPGNISIGPIDVRGSGSGSDAFVGDLIGSI